MPRSAGQALWVVAWAVPLCFHAGNPGQNYGCCCFLNANYSTYASSSGTAVGPDTCDVNF